MTLKEELDKVAQATKEDKEFVSKFLSNKGAFSCFKRGGVKFWYVPKICVDFSVRHIDEMEKLARIFDTKLLKLPKYPSQRIYTPQVKVVITGRKAFAWMKFLMLEWCQDKDLAVRANKIGKVIRKVRDYDRKMFKYMYIDDYGDAQEKS